MPNVNKVVYGNQTLIDLTNSTLSSADQLAQGVTAYDRGGNLLTGTASGGSSAISVVDTLDSHGGTIRTITGVDISNDTVTASHLEQGYTAHDASGNAILGTLVAGGGGLEYETGTVIPTTDETGTIISFTNTHSTPPLFFMFADASGTPAQTANTNLVTMAIQWDQYTGVPISGGQGLSDNYGVIHYRIGTGSGISSTTTSLDSTYGNFITNTEVHINGSNTTRHLVSGRTYKWIAVWAPTT